MGRGGGGGAGDLPKDSPSIPAKFGKRVGIKQEVLDECAKTKSPEVAMLEYWLKATKPTWKDVATTLRVINHPQLAQGIETRHKIGK